MRMISACRLLTCSLTHSFSICFFENLLCISNRDMCAQGAVGAFGGTYSAWGTQERLPEVAVSKLGIKGQVGVSRWRKCFSKGLFRKTQHVQRQEENSDRDSKMFYQTYKILQYVQNNRCFRWWSKREISGGWKCEGGALGKSRPRALKEGSRQQRSQRVHVGGSIAHGKENSALSSGILGKSLRISFQNAKWGK